MPVSPWSSLVIERQPILTSWRPIHATRQPLLSAPQSSRHFVYGLSYVANVLFAHMFMHTPDDNGLKTLNRSWHQVRTLKNSQKRIARD